MSEQYAGAVCDMLQPEGLTFYMVGWAGVHTAS